MTPEIDALSTAAPLRRSGHARRIRSVRGRNGRGLRPLRETARAPGVVHVAFGSIDFQLDLGIAGNDDALLYFRSRSVLESRLAQLPPPNDGVTTAVDDTLRRIASTALPTDECLQSRLAAQRLLSLGAEPGTGGLGHLAVIQFV